MKKEAQYSPGIIKRLLLFFLIIIVFIGLLVLYDYIRGPTEAVESSTTMTIIYYFCWAVVLLIIYRVTKGVLYGKAK